MFPLLPIALIYALFAIPMITIGLVSFHRRNQPDNQRGTSVGIILILLGLLGPFGFILLAILFAIVILYP